MTKEELAARLNGREYLEEITLGEIHEANKSGLIAIFGQSDDRCVVRGAIDSDYVVDNGGTFDITIKTPTSNGKFDVSIIAIEALFADVDYEAGELEDAYTWKYKTPPPHAEFDILEDGEPYCRGIVIDLNEIAHRS